jgi:hypothetical protein
MLVAIGGRAKIGNSRLKFGSVSSLSLRERVRVREGFEIIAAQYGVPSSPPFSQWEKGSSRLFWTAVGEGRNPDD